MAESTTQTEPAKTQEFSSPPAAGRAADQPADGPRQRLHQLAERLRAAPNRRILVEFLQLRRAIR